MMECWGHGKMAHPGAQQKSQKQMSDSVILRFHEKDSVWIMPDLMRIIYVVFAQQVTTGLNWAKINEHQRLLSLFDFLVPTRLGLAQVNIPCCWIINQISKPQEKCRSKCHLSMSRLGFCLQRLNENEYQTMDLYGKTVAEGTINDANMKSNNCRFGWHKQLLGICQMYPIFFGCFDVSAACHRWSSLKAPLPPATRRSKLSCHSETSECYNSLVELRRTIF